MKMVARWRISGGHARGLVPLTELNLVPPYIRHTHMYNSTSLVYSLLYMKQMLLYHLAYKLIIMAVEP